MSAVQSGCRGTNRGRAPEGALALIGWKDLVAKPGSKGVGIRHGERTEAKQGTNLTAKSLAVATGQIEISERLGRDGQLLREIPDPVGRNLTAASRETPFELEELQQHGASEPAAFGTVVQEGPFIVAYRPGLDERLIVPVLFHVATGVEDSPELGNSNSKCSERLTLQPRVGAY